MHELQANDVANPLVFLFRPVLEAGQEKLRREAAGCYTGIVVSSLPSKVCEVMLDVFRDWIAQRFADLDSKEIAKMLTGNLTPLEETKSGQELRMLQSRMPKV
jgi:hypothetical protein